MKHEEQPMALEVAVTPEGNVTVNIQHLPVNTEGWGHLTFDAEEVQAFIQALQVAAMTARSRGKAFIN